MQSFLIISQSSEKAEELAEQICKKEAIHPFDQIKIVPEKSIGIEDIRNLQKNLSLFPAKSKKKAIIIYNADVLTIDAQHALLKTLEEPPLHSIIMLLANSKENFLPTVLSRCSIMSQNDTKKTITPLEQEASITFLEQLPRMSLGDKLTCAQAVGRNKETAVQFLTAAILTARSFLLVTPDEKWARAIRQLQKTHSLLSNTNANPRLAVEHMLLSI